jgi:hypothetical protein
MHSDEMAVAFLAVIVVLEFVSGSEALFPVLFNLLVQFTDYLFI